MLRILIYIGGANKAIMVLLAIPVLFVLSLIFEKEPDMEALKAEAARREEERTAEDPAD